MPAKRNGKYLSNIICPFFRRESSVDHNIVCEGPEFWSSVSVNYGNNEAGRQRHIETFCCSFRYKECRVCRLVSNPKYEEEESNDI